MDLMDFEFKRERKLGEFVQDFINLLKIILGHCAKVMIRLLFVPVCLMVLVSYYISTKYNLSAEFSVDLFFNIGFAFIILSITALVAFGFAIEYFLLIRDTRTLEFDERDVWRNFKENIAKYIRFLSAAFIVSIIAVIPIGIVTFLSVFIPLVGSVGLGIFYAMIGLWYFCAFLLYREGYDDLTDCFLSSFSALRKRVFEYGIASYVVSFLFQSLLSLVVLIPSLLIGLIAYNSLEFNSDFFNTFYGRILVSCGGSLLTLFSIVYAMLAVMSYGIIYETAKELKYGEDIFEKISKIGRSNHG
ncbi:ABC transporter permease [Sphingobacterium pedocola]|uniref:ABC transporter permease n=1 Tax=Sphingobacterium pedocola TaxID=2082722 RepID=A0ABR9TDH8_9SPHI|nr:ABC transporter permease [Sphingobacterium pedocola]MBE8722919.1 ABC transporter permease [Sphingobacterium pedocola]